MSAVKAGITVIGIGQNKIELDCFRLLGAHEVALTISELLESYFVRNYYQIQYLPYAIHLRRMADLKLGYPVSLLDTVKGRITKDDMGEFESEASGYHNDQGEDEEGYVILDRNAERIIPREVLGIRPGTLAGVYINNIGWPQDKIDTLHLDSRELERDVIRMLAKLYGYPPDERTGYVTSGGTEGNFTGLWWQRDYLRVDSDNRPILLTSHQTHYSVSKASQQLDVDGRLIKTVRTGEVDLDDLAKVLDEIA